jgi:hypothetical protein
MFIDWLSTNKYFRETIISFKEENCLQNLSSIQGNKKKTNSDFTMPLV